MKKMDEMEKSLTLQAVKWSWFFTVVSLFIWQTYDFITGKELGIQGLILIGEFFTYFVIKQLLKNKVGDKEGKLNLMFAFVLVIILIAIGLVAYFMFR